MAEIYVKGPDGAVYTVSEDEYQSALNQGYTNVDQATADAAQGAAVSQMGEAEAVNQGLLQASDDGYSPAIAAADKALSAFSFGAMAPSDPASMAAGRRLQEESPALAFGAEVVGQLPLAIAGGVAGSAIRGAAAGAGALARGGALAADVGLNAAVGGAQTEAEETRLSGEDFSFTDAAITGVVGETLGRGAVWTASKALGGARNLMARAERDIVAQDAAQSLSKGGWLSDYRVAQHADRYHSELAELASRDLDQLETSFAEVSRQDRKRARITRAVQDNPEVQDAIRVEAGQGLRGLRDALSDELDGAGGPAKKLLKQLDDRIAALDEGRTGKKLWRVLDENRQALQEYRQDLYQSYESNPGSAWLSREGLAAIDAAEKQTREALLREDAWGQAAAQMQREYNVPFNEKYFPTAKTVRGQLMFSPQKNAEGFSVYRGEPERMRRFLARDAADPDGHRLSEQFRDYLDGVEAIARAGEKDAPKAARDTLEAVRRLRKAVANAAQVSEAASRTKGRTGLLSAGVEVAGATAATIAAGPGTGALGYAALRGARVGDFLTRAGQKLGWGAGAPLDMAKLLRKGELPAAPAGARDSLLDDVLDGPPSKPPSGAPPAPGGGGGGLTPSMRADAARGSWAPSEPPGSGVRATAAESVGDVVPEGQNPIRTAETWKRPEERTEGLKWYGEIMHPHRRARRQDALRAGALAEGEFREVVERLRAVDAKTPDGKSAADALEGSLEQLKSAGLVVAGLATAGALAADEDEGALAAGAAGLGLLAGGKGGLMGKTARAARLEKNLGASKMLGAKFKVAGEAGQAQATAIVKEAIERLPPPPPPRMSPDVPLGVGKGPAKNEFEKMIQKSKAALEHLDREERAALADWVGSSNMARTQQRTGTKVWHGDQDVAVFESAVDKITVLDPTKHGDLFRFITLDDEGLAELLTRDEYVAGATMSAGYVPDQNFGPHELRFTKVDSAGALIGLNPAESEMLIPMDARFRVTGRYANPETGNFTFTLEEVPATRSAAADVGYLSLPLAAAGAAEATGEEDGVAAGAMAPLALFGRRASLFKGARAKVVADVAKRLFSATAEPTARVVSRLAYNRNELKARQEEFQAWQENPQELVERVAEGFRDVPPEHSGTVASGVFRTATFLKEKLPTVTKLNAVSLRQIPVSNEAMAKYARYEQAALRPREALQEGAQTGHLSAELMETLQELYPDLLAELRVGAIMQVKENGPPTTVQSKLSYARLFDGRGELADPSMSQTVANMTAYAYQQAVPTKPGGGPTSSGNVSHVAAASAAPRMGRVG